MDDAEIKTFDDDDESEEKLSAVESFEQYMFKLLHPHLFPNDPIIKHAQLEQRAINAKLEFYNGKSRVWMLRGSISPADRERLKKLLELYNGVQAQINTKKIQQATDGTIRPVAKEFEAIGKLLTAMREIIVNKYRLHPAWCKPKAIGIILYEE